jgi:hypothetical protein
MKNEEWKGKWQNMRGRGRKRMRSKKHSVMYNYTLITCA